MKKLLTVLSVVLFVLTLSSCKSNMRRDVKRLTHKTEQCFSKVDMNDPSNLENEEFSKCYDELEALMTQYDEKYKDSVQSVKFGKMYLEELQKSNVPDEFKELFNFLYGLGSDSQDFMFENNNFLEEEDSLSTIPVV